MNSSKMAALGLLGVSTVAGAAPGGGQSYSFAIERARGSLYNPWTGSDDPVELRSFVGSGARAGDFVAPTIRIAPGERLTVDLDKTGVTSIAASTAWR